jgi:colanic acid/amylovoran biosynthesis glycosyltransferase
MDSIFVNGSQEARLRRAVVVAWQRFWQLVRSCGILCERSVRFRLILLGDGPRRKHLQRLVCEHGLSRYVDFLGWLPEEDVRRYLWEATVAIVPSIVASDGDQDGIPNVVLEACASGTPLIASRLPGVVEVIDDQINGLLVEPGDSDALANAIERILRDESLRHHLSGNARDRIGADFDVRKNVQRVGQLFLGS